MELRANPMTQHHKSDAQKTHLRQDWKEEPVFYLLDVNPRFVASGRRNKKTS